MEHTKIHMIRNSDNNMELGIYMYSDRNLSKNSQNWFDKIINCFHVTINYVYKFTQVDQSDHL